MLTSCKLWGNATVPSALTKAMGKLGKPLSPTPDKARQGAAYILVKWIGKPQIILLHTYIFEADSARISTGVATDEWLRLRLGRRLRLRLRFGDWICIWPVVRWLGDWICIWLVVRWLDYTGISTVFSLSGRTSAQADRAKRNTRAQVVNLFIWIS